MSMAVQRSVDMRITEGVPKPSVPDESSAESDLSSFVGPLSKPTQLPRRLRRGGRKSKGNSVRSLLIESRLLAPAPNQWADRTWHWDERVLARRPRLVHFEHIHHTCGDFVAVAYSWSEDVNATAKEIDLRRSSIFTCLKPHAFDICRVFALTFRHRYALSLLQGMSDSDHHLHLLTEQDPFNKSTADGPLPLLYEPIEKKSHIVYDMMMELFRPEGSELYSRFACRMFQEAVKVARDFRNNGCITIRHVFNLIMVESKLRGTSTSAAGRWSASRFVQDATVELTYLTGTAVDENDYVVNLARTIQLLLTILQVTNLVRRLEQPQISFADRKKITDFGEMVLKKEPCTWY